MKDEVVAILLSVMVVFAVVYAVVSFILTHILWIVGICALAYVVHRRLTRRARRDAHIAALEAELGLVRT